MSIPSEPTEWAKTVNNSDSLAQIPPLPIEISILLEDLPRVNRFWLQQIRHRLKPFIPLYRFGYSTSDTQTFDTLADTISPMTSDKDFGGMH